MVKSIDRNEKNLENKRDAFQKAPPATQHDAIKTTYKKLTMQILM
jgi:hypothetical protein